MVLRRLPVLALVWLALAPAFAQQTPPTARELYERAAYAEEHDHDLAAAEKGFREAADAATKAGDANLATQANAALARVLARQGKETPPEQPTELFPQAQRLIAEGSLMEPTDEALSQLVTDLLVFGRALVPALEPLLIDPSPGMIEIGEHVASVNPEFAARALSKLDVPEALQTLGKGLDSPDPLVRKAVVSWLRAPRHFDLLRRAASDPVPPVRDLAFEKLESTPDLALNPLMITGARQGAPSAIGWLSSNDPLSLMEIVDEGVVDEEHLPKRLYRQSELRGDIATVERLIEIYRSAEKESVRRSARSCLNELLQATAAAGPLDPALEAIVMREIERDPTPDAISSLQFLAPGRALETATRLLESSDAPLSEAEQTAFFVLLNAIAARTPAVGAARDWLRVQQAAARRTTSWEQEGDSKLATDASAWAIKKRLEREADDEVVLAWFQGASPGERERNAWQLSEWLNSRMVSLGRGESSATIDRSLLPVIEFVLEIGRQQNEQTRLNALNAFAAIGDPNQFERCLDEYDTDFSGGLGQVVRRVGGSLAGLDPRHASDVLDGRIRAHLAEVPLSRQGHRMIQTIAWLPAADALLLFRKLWTEPMGQDARNALLWQLVDYIEGPEATALVLELYSEFPPDGEESSLRDNAIGRFAAELYEPAIPLLEQALKDPAGNVRSRAREASEAFKLQRQALEEFQAWTNASQAARDSIDELKALLADPHREVVLGAVRALGVVKARTALPELVKLLGRDDAALRAEVQAAIDRIGE